MRSRTEEDLRRNAERADERIERQEVVTAYLQLMTKGCNQSMNIMKTNKMFFFSRSSMTEYMKELEKGFG